MSCITQEQGVPSTFGTVNPCTVCAPLGAALVTAGVRDAVSLLEALGEAAASTRNPVLLTEYVRQALRRTVVKPYLNRAGELPAWFIDAAIEQSVEAAVEHGEQNSHISLAPQTGRDIVKNRHGRERCRLLENHADTPADRIAPIQEVLAQHRPAA